jgi:RNA polymerase sigma-70 factor (ECF subfamily)
MGTSRMTSGHYRPPGWPVSRESNGGLLTLGRARPSSVMGMSVDLACGIGQSRVVDRMSVETDTSACDAGLVRAAQEGDRDAFGRLYQRYGPMVHGVLLARVPYGEVDDLVQDVFLTALQRLPMLRAAAAFPAWLASIARNRATDYHRRRPVTTDAVDLAAPEQPERAEALSVLAAIRSLPEAYRETLTLRFVEGMTGPEIAARTGLTAGSVRVNLHRGMTQLREKLSGGRNRHE